MFLDYEQLIEARKKVTNFDQYMGCTWNKEAISTQFNPIFQDKVDEQFSDEITVEIALMKLAKQKVFPINLTHLARAFLTAEYLLRTIYTPLAQRAFHIHEYRGCSPEIVFRTDVGEGLLQTLLILEVTRRFLDEQTGKSSAEGLHPQYSYLQQLALTRQNIKPLESYYYERQAFQDFCLPLVSSSQNGQLLVRRSAEAILDRGMPLWEQPLFTSWAHPNLTRIGVEIALAKFNAIYPLSADLV